MQIEKDETEKISFSRYLIFYPVKAFDLIARRRKN